MTALKTNLCFELHGFHSTLLNRFDLLTASGLSPHSRGFEVHTSRHHIIVLGIEPVSSKNKGSLALDARCDHTLTPPALAAATAILGLLKLELYSYLRMILCGRENGRI